MAGQWCESNEICLYTNAPRRMMLEVKRTRGEGILTKSFSRGCSRRLIGNLEMDFDSRIDESYILKGVNLCEEENYLT